MAVLRQELQQGADVQVVVIIDVTEPPATDDAEGQENAFCVRVCDVCLLRSASYFLPDFMKASYSRAILQERA